jgi:GT2 family glycosyltransferase
MPTKVSVIIPTFNRSRFLGEALDSVLVQSHRDFEVIVIDDGSTDGTPELVAEYAARDDRIRSHRQANAGVSRARNAGLDLAKGDHIAFLDSDDAWQPWHLELMLAGLARHPNVGLIWAEADLVDESGRIVASPGLPVLLSAYRYFAVDQLFPIRKSLADLGVTLPDGLKRHRLFVGDIFSAMILGNLVLTSSTVMRRDLAERIGRFDETTSVGEDFGYFLKASRAAPAAFIDLPGARYRVGTVDKLAGPANTLAMATAYLRTLDAALAVDGARIKLRPALIREAKVHAERWLGEAELRSGSRAAARSHLIRAFALRPTQLAILPLILATLAPPWVLQRAINARRAVLHVLAGGRPRA